MKSVINTTAKTPEYIANSLVSAICRDNETTIDKVPKNIIDQLLPLITEAVDSGWVPGEYQLQMFAIGEKQDQEYYAEMIPGGNGLDIHKILESIFQSIT